MKEKMITTMNRKIIIHSLPIVMAAMMMAACSYEDMAEITGDDTLEARTWQVSINAGPAETKAISIGGNNGQTLYTNWDPDDAVEVVKDGASVGTLHADVSAGNSAYATLTGTLTGTFAVNDEVTLYYHTDVVVEVEAENEDEALANAYLEVGKKKYDAQLLHNLTEDCDPDVYDLEEDE